MYIDIEIPNVEKLKDNAFLKKDKQSFSTMKNAVKLTRYIIHKTKGGRKIRNSVTQVFDLENKYLHICSESAKIFVSIM